MNGLVHVFCKILRNIMTSAAEVELGTVLINAQDEVPIQTALIDMGHPQPSTTV